MKVLSVEALDQTKNFLSSSMHKLDASCLSLFDCWADEDIDTLVDTDGRFTRVPEADLILREVESLPGFRERPNLKAEYPPSRQTHLKFADSIHQTSC